MFRLIKNLARGTKTSLRSKRFRLVSEQKETVEGDFRFRSLEKLNKNQKMKQGGGVGEGRKRLQTETPRFAFPAHAAPDWLS